MDPSGENDGKAPSTRIRDKCGSVDLIYSTLGIRAAVEFIASTLFPRHLWYPTRLESEETKGL
jgi:hypothetical protein